MALYHFLTCPSLSLPSPLPPAPSSLQEGKLVYHPYTIRGLLDPSRKGMRYDNTDAGFDQSETDPRRSSFEAQGHDKVGPIDALSSPYRRPI